MDELNGLILAAEHDRIHGLRKPGIQGIRDSQMTQPGRGVGKNQKQLPVCQFFNGGIFHLLILIL